ncbi:MAG: hypothetical protein BWK74_07840 [Desulfobacteraceae bacterium A6]|nr:MAG: hypothetical protein BWK74_07840 [Desulfobacteraceae bacterium A6]
MDVTFVDNLIDGYLKAVERSRDDIQSGDGFYNDNFGILLAQVIPEIVSRLCCKCSNEAKYKLIDFLFDIYKSDQRNKYRGIRHLTERLLRSFSCHQRFELIHRLLEFPIPGDLHPIVEDEFINPFYFLEIDKELASSWSRPCIDDNKLIYLLNEANSENQAIRKWSTFTLVRLHELNLLKKTWADKLGKTLWFQRDEFGFPAHTFFRKFAFLRLPHPKNIDPILLFKKFIENSPLPIQKNSTEKGVAFTRGNVPLCDEIVGARKSIQWKEDESIIMLQRLVEWWDADKTYLKKDKRASSFTSIPDEFRSRFSKLVNVLVEVIAPSLRQETENNVKNTIWRLLSELGDYGVPSLQAETACIHVYPDTRGEVISRIEDALASSEYEAVIDGLKAIIVIFQRPKLPVNDMDMSNLLCVLSQLVRFRKKIGLPSALNTVAVLIRNYPSLFNKDFEALTLKGLKDIAQDTDLMVGSDDFDFSSKLEIRQEAAGLAYVLFDHYSKQGSPKPDVIKAWEVICRSDNEFAEIRNKWLFDQLP